MADQALLAKRIVGTNVLVDGFRFQSPEFQTYFLTHAHSDHTTGLTRGFSAGTIYCSPVTAALILHDTPRVKDHSRVVALEVGRTHRIEDARCGAFDVTLVDANHCPGACVLVFDVPVAAGEDGAGGAAGGGGAGSKRQQEATTKRRIVHTGDFRFHELLHGRHPLLLSSSSSLTTPSLPVDTLLLDTTYAHPRHCHPSQELAIRACAEFVRRESSASSAAFPSAAAASSSSSSAAATASLQPPPPRPLFVFGSYRVGKERLYLGVARELGWKIWVPPQKRRLLELLGLLSDDAADDDEEEENEEKEKEQQSHHHHHHSHRRYPRSLLADSPTEAVLHVAPMGASLTPPALLSRLQPGGDAQASGCGRVVGIRPTGWTWRAPKKGGARDRAAKSDSDLSSALVTSWSPLPGVTVAGVPYSEHSSFPELRAAVAAMRPRRLVPTVTGGTAGDREAIAGRFSDLLDRKRDRSRLDFFFSSAARKDEGKSEEFGEAKVEEEEAAKTKKKDDGGDAKGIIKVKEERGSDDDEEDDDSWGPVRGGDDWALDDEDDEEMKKEEGRDEAAAAVEAAAVGPSASAPAVLPPPPPPPLSPPAPFDLSSVDASEQRRILAEIQAVATAEKLLRDLKQGGEGGGGGGKRRRQPTLAAFAAAANKKKNK